MKAARRADWLVGTTAALKADSMAVSLAVLWALMSVATWAALTAENSAVC